jgi:hypothetical protein
VRRNDLAAAIKRAQDLINERGELPYDAAEKLLMLQDNPVILSRELAKLSVREKE